jgi:hypothetical protein
METHSFVGVDAFDSSEEIFSDLIDQNLILICLDSERRSRKERFCFKGCCSFGLIYGHVQTNGYKIKNTELNPNEFMRSPLKWFELYSPETNSYLNVSNKQNENIDPNNVPENAADSLIQKIITNLNVTTPIEDRLRDFLGRNDFSLSSSSLIAVTFLKSQLANYINYFDNFKTVYQQTSKSDAENRAQAVKLTARLAKGGIFPVSEENLNAVHTESSEENAIVDQLIGKASNQNEGMLRKK